MTRRGFFGVLVAAAVAPFINKPKVPEFTSGGYIKRPTALWGREHGPETVLPLKTLRIELDEKQITETVVVEIPRLIRRHGLV